MSDRPDKARRRELLRQVAEKQRADALAELPADRDELQALFDMLDRELPRRGCDHTLRMTESHLAEHGLSRESIVPWLHKHGGFCDCEVLANVEEFWRSLIEAS